MSTERDFLQIVKETRKQETKAYDTEAKVVRVENGTAWVHIAGGVDETPVKLNVNAKIGDIVQVRVAEGSAWLTGNNTAPPTDDTRANEAHKVATNANKVAEVAVQKTEVTSEKVIELEQKIITASGITIWYSVNDPSLSEKVKDGDIWYKLDANNLSKVVDIFVWQNSIWNSKEYDGSVITAGTITALEIAGQTITAEKINMENLQSKIGYIGDTNNDKAILELKGDSIAIGYYDKIAKKIVSDLFKVVVEDEGDAYGRIEYDAYPVFKYPKALQSEDAPQGYILFPRPIKELVSITLVKNDDTEIEIYGQNVGFYNPDDNSGYIIENAPTPFSMQFVPNFSREIGTFQENIKHLLIVYDAYYTDIELQGNSYIYGNGYFDNNLSVAENFGVDKDVQIGGKLKIGDRFESGLFSTTSVSNSSAWSISGNTAVEKTITFKRIGWYPFAIAGYNFSGTGVSSLNVYAVYLSARSDGSCTITAKMRNTTGSNASITLQAYVLWIKSY